MHAGWRIILKTKNFLVSLACHVTSTLLCLSGSKWHRRRKWDCSKGEQQAAHAGKSHLSSKQSAAKKKEKRAQCCCTIELRISQTVLKFHSLCVGSCNWGSFAVFGFSCFLANVDNMQLPEPMVVIRLFDSLCLPHILLFLHQSQWQTHNPNKQNKTNPPSLQNKSMVREHILESPRSKSL